MRNTQYGMDFDYVYDRPLAPDGCDGDGSLCGFHCLCSSTEFEGVNTTSLRALTLRRILGLFSQYVFNANVMVRVATRPADNPVGAMARKFHIGGAMAKNAPR